MNGADRKSVGPVYRTVATIQTEARLTAEVTQTKYSALANPKKSGKHFPIPFRIQVLDPRCHIWLILAESLIFWPEQPQENLWQRPPILVSHMHILIVHHAVPLRTSPTPVCDFLPPAISPSLRIPIRLTLPRTPTRTGLHSAFRQRHQTPGGAALARRRRQRRRH